MTLGVAARDGRFGAGEVTLHPLRLAGSYSLDDAAAAKVFMDKAGTELSNGEYS